MQAALQGIKVRLQQVALTEQRLQLLKNERESIARQFALGGATILDLRRARLKVIAGETDLLRDVIQWKLEVVKLKESQGMLAEECGYSCRACCCRG